MSEIKQLRGKTFSGAEEALRDVLANGDQIDQVVILFRLKGEDDILIAHPEITLEELAYFARAAGCYSDALSFGSFYRP